MTFLCTLDPNLRKCSYIADDNKHCNGDGMCGFCEKTEEASEPEPVKHEYVRKERWYEQYMK